MHEFDCGNLGNYATASNTIDTGGPETVIRVNNGNGNGHESGNGDDYGVDPEDGVGYLVTPATGYGVSYDFMALPVEDTGDIADTGEPEETSADVRALVRALDRARHKLREAAGA